MTPPHTHTVPKVLTKKGIYDELPNGLYMDPLCINGKWQVYCLFAQKLFIKQRVEINKYVQFELVYD